MIIHGRFGQLLVIGVAASTVVAVVAYAHVAGADISSEPRARSGAPQLSAEPLADIATPVSGVSVVRGAVVLTVTAAAEAAAWRETVLSAARGGQVVSMSVGEGDRVVAGQLLAALDPTDARLELREAEAELERAESSFREMTLLDERLDDASLRAERERAARARSGLVGAELRVERARLSVVRTRVRAPFGGRAASIEARAGTWLGAGAPLMRLVDADSIRVEVQVLDGEVRWLERGGRALVEFPALPGESFAGRIATVNPLVDPEQRTARVTVVVANADGRVLPGMYARVTLETRSLPDRLLVPREAVLERDRRTLVFVFEGDSSVGRAAWRTVALGAGTGELVELLEGAEGTDPVVPGEIVLTDGHFSLIHDARVVLRDPPGDTAPDRSGER